MLKSNTLAVLGWLVAIAFVWMCAAAGIVVLGIVTRMIVWCFMNGYHLFKLP